MREGREKSLQIAGAAQRGAGKDLDVVRACVPCGDDFGGRERAGMESLPCSFCGGDDLGMQTGADNEFSAGVDGGLGFAGGGHGAGAEEKLGCRIPSSAP